MKGLWALARKQSLRNSLYAKIYLNKSNHNKMNFRIEEGGKKKKKSLLACLRKNKINPESLEQCVSGNICLSTQTELCLLVVHEVPAKT